MRAPKELSWDTGGRQEMGGAHDLSCSACDQDVNTCRGAVLCPIRLCVWILKALCSSERYTVPSTAHHPREGFGVLLLFFRIRLQSLPVADRRRVVRNVSDGCCSNAPSRFVRVSFAVGNLALEKCTAILQGKIQCPPMVTVEQPQWPKAVQLNTRQMCVQSAVPYRGTSPMRKQPTPSDLRHRPWVGF